MKTQNLLQGSPQWLAYRAQHFNASDAPAMMGASAYKTRTQLLHEMHTGMTPDVDAATQRLFDDGHRFEALARPLAEQIIEADLYPVTGSEGRLSASFDGLTMDDATIFEHKTLNSELRAAFDMIDTIAPEYRTLVGAAELPLMYRIQMEQQLMVSGAERCLFMASSWNGDELVEERHAWYYPDQALRSTILQGWTQFAIDLENYVPEATEAKTVGRTPETLPALHIEVTGMVTASNLAEYKAHALAVFAGINRNLVTDSDFANAESTVKWCGDIETRLAAAKQHALSQTASIDQLFKAIDDISAEARATRLELDKLVKNRKDSIRSDIVRDGRNAMADHLDKMTARVGNLMPSIPVDFAGVIKGKRTLESMRDAVATELARAKIAANEMADKITLNLRIIYEADDFKFLFSDVSSLAIKDPEFVAMAVKNRIADHQAKEVARLAAETARIAEQERVKAEAAATKRANVEIAAATAAAQADAARASAEAIAKAAQLAPMTLATAPPCHQTIVPVLSDKATADRNAVAFIDRIEAKQAPSLSLGQISERLGFNVTSVFLATLGFEATTVKAAKLFQESDFPRICQALVMHINRVNQGVTA
jgi:putative phage-type endonuclease